MCSQHLLLLVPADTPHLAMPACHEDNPNHKDSTDITTSKHSMADVAAAQNIKTMALHKTNHELYSISPPLLTHSSPLVQTIPTHISSSGGLSSTLHHTSTACSDIHPPRPRTHARLHGPSLPTLSWTGFFHHSCVHSSRASEGARKCQGSSSAARATEKGAVVEWCRTHLTRLHRNPHRFMRSSRTIIHIMMIVSRLIGCSWLLCISLWVHLVVRSLFVAQEASIL